MSINLLLPTETRRVPILREKKFKSINLTFHREDRIYHLFMLPYTTSPDNSSVTESIYCRIYQLLHWMGDLSVYNIEK